MKGNVRVGLSICLLSCFMSLWKHSYRKFKDSENIYTRRISTLQLKHALISPHIATNPSKSKTNIVVNKCFDVFFTLCIYDTEYAAGVEFCWFFLWRDANSKSNVLIVLFHIITHPTKREHNI